MNVLITGGTGFIGKQIAKEILKTGSLTLDGKQAKPIDKIILFDAFAGDDLPQDPKIEVVIGDITDKTITDDHICGALKQGITFNISTIIESWRCRQQLSRRSDRNISFVGFGTNVQQGDARTRHT